MKLHKYFFDTQDYELLNFVNKITLVHAEEGTISEILDTNLHPHGIKTLALSREMRVAVAVMRFLDSLEARGSKARLQALQAMYDDVLNSAITKFRRNTARVLVEIMKDLVRNQGKTQAQLYLAHDFRRASQGNPHVIRKFLDRYGLVEMPEKWNQLVFDHHVHDAHSRGRKNPSHLIMDAWLQGIRYLTVIYYNYVNHDVAHEILKAAEIMDIEVRIGIEFSVPFYNKHIQLVWSQKEANQGDRLLSFLEEAPMQHLLQLGKQASEWRQQFVYDVLDLWNQEHRVSFAHNYDLDLELPMISKDAFKKFVGTGQASLDHLCEYIFMTLRSFLEDALLRHDDASPITQSIDHLLQSFSVSVLFNDYLNPSNNQTILEQLKKQPTASLPELLKFSPYALLDWLTTMQPNYLITLNAADLSAEDTLELLWQTQGMITHLELYNQKEWHKGRLKQIGDIIKLRNNLNSGSVPRLKYDILHMLNSRVEHGPLQGESHEVHNTRCIILRQIVRNIPELKSFYADKHLRTRMGSNSTGRMGSEFNMGIAFPETLPMRAQKTLKACNAQKDIPFHLTTQSHHTYTPRDNVDQISWFTKIIRTLPFCSNYGLLHKQHWMTRSSTAKLANNGNLALLGAVRNKKKFQQEPQKSSVKNLFYLNTNFTNILKILAGFIPAVIAFQYTQSWWFLAWFGPVIWFAITGIRNIIQAVMAGGGLHRATLLRWNNYVSWSRLADSLLYTGLSVPILEWGVRIMLLDNWLNVTVASNSLLAYSTMSCVNGFYIASHNIFRGLPKEAVIGNLFRSVLAIPMAVLLSSFCLYCFTNVFYIENPEALLAVSSAIISKLASDIVAALIEGYADHKNNVRMRNWDYETKLDQTFKVYVKLELLFPEEDLYNLISQPKELLARLEKQDPELRKALVITALDFMYFWLYRPRSQEVCKKHLSKLSKEELIIFARMQMVLMREHEISRLFVDGLVGKKFGKSLAFYLAEHNNYLKQTLALCKTT